MAADQGLLGLREERGEGKKRKTRTILDRFGQSRIDRITQGDVTAWHLSWSDTPTRANRGLALVSHMFTMAAEWGIRAGTNPCHRVRRFKEAKRERFLAAAELARLGAALKAMEKAGKVTPYGLAAVRLLVFTGARASEVLGLTWNRVNLEAGAVRLSQSKEGGPKTLILNPPAAAVLSSLRRMKGNPHVVVGGKANAALTLSGLEQVWQEVRRAAGLDDVRLHDLRHSFASVAVAGGASLPIIGALLGHSRAETTKRYAHLSAAPLQAASGTIAASIADAMDGKRPRRANVTAMRRGTPLRTARTGQTDDPMAALMAALGDRGLPARAFEAALGGRVGAARTLLLRRSRRAAGGPGAPH